MFKLFARRGSTERAACRVGSGAAACLAAADPQGPEADGFTQIQIIHPLSSRQAFTSRGLSSLPWRRSTGRKEGVSKPTHGVGRPVGWGMFQELTPRNVFVFGKRGLAFESVLF